MGHWGGSAVLGSPQVEQLPSLGMGRDKGDGAGGQGRIITSSHKSQVTNPQPPVPSPKFGIWVKW
ncbi:hypothetical protein VF14_15480 [Nostoc linckia z18]|uniref:Uncharacterized protein n=2 Tax=Nostoc linckia TaxID=92942 RepID=A0A9Q5Z708_NOSLI|nr:hypothetical protein VF05_35305 [Nostoc linckia z3]PHJ59157.1 hypothetical protein VF02_25805 [Nostoc linckia z1]PHJ60550.1 hypothetical protein VF03_33260 [Nostoc linckia z2]PHJ74434.1 hypothetical protein VF06_34775 [Nostoc linckia z4]PHJ77856.1 hypothetical protein VF07_35735 [Nostoc linckia z6]PHJ90300.1 hypothetical protein VF04_31085 [Nostoc linckia z7]PHJ96945.1 hypothetical protein VF08_29600 [Nostoc linckia z8]PHK05042.1 hypothetical protein VF09_27440 [Nostoc linckia z9]PHK1592